MKILSTSGCCYQDVCESLSDLARDNVFSGLNGTACDELLNSEMNEWFEDLIFNADGEFKKEIVCFFKDIALDRFGQKRLNDSAFIETRHMFDAWFDERVRSEYLRLSRIDKLQ